MKNHKPPYIVRPQTALITRGFDPGLSAGSARPPVFRSATYVFSSPEAAAKAFAIATGKAPIEEGERTEFIYSRLAHPNADIVEDQIVTLEPGARSAAVFNSGMAAITTLFFAVCEPRTTFVYTTPLYGGTYHFIHRTLARFGVTGIAAPAGDTDKLRRAIRSADGAGRIVGQGFTPRGPLHRAFRLRAMETRRGRHHLDRSRRPND
jgi:methionine-gamma-lyase